MERNINEINRITLDGNENIVIQDVSNSTVTINKNNTEEIKEFFSAFGNKIMQLEDIISGNKMEFAKLKSLLVEQYVKINKTVMVVGTGSYNLPENVYKSSVLVAKLLSELNYKVVVGGWEGVDYVVADEYSKIISTTDFSLSEMLTQVVTKGKAPIFKGGEITYVENGVMEWIEGLKKAKALIVIGGNGGSYETFLYAKQEKVVVIPIAYSGGDAERIYNEISTELVNFDFLNNFKDDFLMLKSKDFIFNLKYLLKNLFE
ncbi:MAG: hypothetical protein JXR68_10505 [Bacteroidales bacterium]|nr:hypothetical protein [Bacteroidales bacterium]